MENTERPDRNTKKAKMSKHSSNYSRKATYLRTLSRRAGYQVFGFEVPEPKPWKVKK